MPKGNPRRAVTQLTLTAEEETQFKRALAESGAEAMRYVREAVMDRVAEELGEHRPGVRPRRQADPTPRRSLLDALLDPDSHQLNRWLEDRISAKLDALLEARRQPAAPCGQPLSAIHG